MKIQSPKKYSPFTATTKLREKFSTDVRTFIKESTLAHNSNWKTEMLMTLKQINANPTDNDFHHELKDTIINLDKKRNSKITNFIPEFYNYFS